MSNTTEPNNLFLQNTLQETQFKFIYKIAIAVLIIIFTGFATLKIINTCSKKILELQIHMENETIKQQNSTLNTEIKQQKSALNSEIQKQNSILTAKIQQQATLIESLQQQILDHKETIATRKIKEIEPIKDLLNDCINNKTTILTICILIFLLHFLYYYFRTERILFALKLATNWTGTWFTIVFIVIPYLILKKFSFNTVFVINICSIVLCIAIIIFFKIVFKTLYLLNQQHQREKHLSKIETLNTEQQFQIKLTENQQQLQQKSLANKTNQS